MVTNGAGIGTELG